MKATVQISPTAITAHEGSAIKVLSEGTVVSDLYFDFSSLLRAVPQPSEAALDFLLVAATVYTLDKLVSRSDSKDGWQRSFEVEIPVRNAKRWTANSETANQCLSFLSGDSWKLSFGERSHPIVRRKQRKRRSRTLVRPARGSQACLFSGGLDSLIGAIDCLEATDGEPLCLVGHHDPNIGGVQKDQEQILEVLRTLYPNRCRPILVGVGHSGKSAEITMRSRSVLFVALGIVVAAHLGDRTPLLIPENGTIALNVPLTPSRRGSCSTRTAHPHYLSLLQDWLDGVGLAHPLLNPLLDKTKGEAGSQCLNQAALKKTALLSCSCAKRGHTSSWVRRTAGSCGRCMPCIYRRAALHLVGMDSEVYGNDICAGEVDVCDPDSDAADDLRACVSFLRRNHSVEAIAKMLLASGPLPPTEAMQHASTVARAMDEIRQLLRDKGTGVIRNLAGVVKGVRGAN
jgi:hypothetical protein